MPLPSQACLHRNSLTPLAPSRPLSPADRSEPPHHKGLDMSRKRYGPLNFAFDAILTILTGGLWLIWVFVREMRSR